MGQHSVGLSGFFLCVLFYSVLSFIDTSVLSWNDIRVMTSKSM